MDYAAWYDLLQFQFDRHILRTLLGSDQHTRKLELDQTNEHRHWTPNYWRKQHRFLIDLVEQFGPPQVFFTLAPYEFDFPWPEWLRRAFHKSCLGPTQLPGAEALAIGHAIQQFCGSYLAGFGSNHIWTGNLFATKTESPNNNVRAYVGRVEFQDVERLVCAVCKLCIIKKNSFVVQDMNEIIVSCTHSCS